jgi:hypothetical protein
MSATSSAAHRTSPLSDDDSDFSDFEPDQADLESETVNNNWLDEVDEVIEVVPSSPLPKCSFTDMLKGKTVHQRAYVTNNSGLYHALCAVEDLEFATLVPAIQIVLMKSLIVQRFQPGKTLLGHRTDLKREVKSPYIVMTSNLSHLHLWATM